MSSIKVLQYYYGHHCTASMRIQYPFWFGRVDKEADTETDRQNQMGSVPLLVQQSYDDDADDCFLYIALFFTLEQTRCARM